MSRKPSDYPRILSVPSHRLWAIAWAVLFFVVINLIVIRVYGTEQPFTRFSYHTSYEEVRDTIDRIKQDPHKKIIFIGGSVMWGAGSPNASDTIPAAFSDLLKNPDIHVYNLGIIGARPLDEFLIAYLLRDQADLLIADYNYEFGLPINHDLLLQDEGTWARQSQLFATDGPAFLADVPGITSCMAEAGLTPPRPAPTIEAHIRTFMEQTVPVLHYKDRINDQLFGQHPLLLIQRAFLLASKAVRDHTLSLFTIVSLFLPPEETINSAPWVIGGPVGSTAIKTQAFDPNNLHTCISRAWTAYTTKHPLPLVTYLLPNNTGMFPGLIASALHRNNVAVLQQAFSGSTFINLDDGSMNPTLFTDSTHLTPAGTHAFARTLLDHLSPILAHHAL